MDKVQVPQLAGLHFLVAEEDGVERAALAAMLRGQGATSITEVLDGHLALRWLEETGANRIDIALLELTLPGVDALELMRRLAVQGSTVRLIVLGTQAPGVMFSIETLAQAYGVDLLGTILKPATDGKLAALLAHYVAPSTAAAPIPVPVFGLAEVSEAIKAHQFVPFFQPRSRLAAVR